MSGLRPLGHERAVASRGPLAAGLAALADLLFPPFCAVCGARLGAGCRDPLCASCWAALPRLAPPFCHGCGAPLGAWLSRAPEPPRRCAACRRRAPRWSYARSAGRFEGPLREALHAFKFDGRRALARPLGDLLAETRPWLPAPLDAGAVLVPVPLHPARRRARGFNQAQLLARRVGDAWGLEVVEAMRRVRPTRPQVELSAAERRGNVRGAFAVRRADAVVGRHVLLVDDVLTTGATVEECATRLRAAGATGVGVLTVARA